jgi:diguanylate cyclase (GGDEF)-like protein/PAS domain S-box-containing protein
MRQALRTKRRRPIAAAKRLLPATTRPDYGELCRAYPGPAAFIDSTGRVLDSNDDAGALLERLDRRTGGLAALVSAAGQFARTDIVEIAGAALQRIELALVPVTSGLLLLGRDRALSDRLQLALAESRARYKDLVEISSDFVWEVDGSGVFVFVSPHGAIGFTADRLVGTYSGDLLGEIDAEPGSVPVFHTRERIDAALVWVAREDGKAACLQVSAVPLYDAQGTWCGARGVGRDVTEIIERDGKIADAEQRQRLLARVMRQLADSREPQAALEAALETCVRAFGAEGGGVWRVVGDSPILAAPIGEAGAFAHIAETLVLGTDPAELDRGDRILLTLPTRFRKAVNGVLLLWRGAEEWPAEDTNLFERVADQFGLALAQFDAQQELERQANTDGLTGLLNRRAFMAELEVRVRHVQRSRRSGALVYVDLDNFKPVNDLHGHAQGDAVLKTVAEHLRRNARIGDLVARLGGDEFALWLTDVDAGGAAAKGEAMLTIREAIASLSAAPEKPLGLSVGVAMLEPESGEDMTALIERADRAMYGAKRSGKGRVTMASAAGAAS